MVMTPILKIPAVELDYVQRSLVRHVINSIKELDIHHMLVIETANTGKQTIRGLFSSSQIGKALGRRIYELLRHPIRRPRLYRNKTSYPLNSSLQACRAPG